MADRDRGFVTKYVVFQMLLVCISHAAQANVPTIRAAATPMEDHFRLLNLEPATVSRSPALKNVECTSVQELALRFRRKICCQQSKRRQEDGK